MGKDFWLDLDILCADGIVINMVVGGEVVTLKNVEESSGLIIAEMPIDVSLTCAYIAPKMKLVVCFIACFNVLLFYL